MIRGSRHCWGPAAGSAPCGDSNIDLNVLLSASKFTDQFLIRDESIKNLHVRFGTEGIEIPFPIRTLHIRGTGTVAPDQSPGPAGEGPA